MSVLTLKSRWPKFQNSKTVLTLQLCGVWESFSHWCADFALMILSRAALPSPAYVFCSGPSGHRFGQCWNLTPAHESIVYVKTISMLHSNVFHFPMQTLLVITIFPTRSATLF